MFTHSYHDRLFDLAVAHTGEQVLGVAVVDPRARCAPVSSRVWRPRRGALVSIDRALLVATVTGVRLFALDGERRPRVWASLASWPWGTFTAATAPAVDGRPDRTELRVAWRDGTTVTLAAGHDGPLAFQADVLALVADRARPLWVDEPDLLGA